MTPSPHGTSNGSDDDDYVDISSSDYARRRKELLTLCDDLRGMGAQTMLSIPKIAVIGGQSAGKSSLVEAVSGINVPRDSGTCTRCPMECYLSSSLAAWSCQITLRFHYDDRGSTLTSPRTIPFGPLLTDKAHVELWLRRAQSAILCPHLDSTVFYGKSKEDLRAMQKDDAKVLKFSRNSVSVKIEDPEATDLAFVDLPGLIQNESQETVDLVKDLVVHNIKDEQTIILVTIPCSDDMENQLAVRLARETDPSGERTVGVLTKPDTLTRGATSARQKWKDVLLGQAHPLTHGYYCVRLPDDDERARGVTRTEADQTAAAFFAGTPPWSQVMQVDESRFGIPSFVSKISVLLTDRIEKAIPQLKRDVAQLLRDTAALLAAMPEPVSSDSMTELLMRVNTFSDQLRNAVHAGPGKRKWFVQRNRARYTVYKKAIRATAPDFRPFERPKLYCRARLGSNDLNGPDDDDDENEDEEGVMGVHYVRQVIKGELGWELPHYVPYDATKVLINGIVEQWRAPTLECFENVFTTLAELVDALISEAFGRFRLLESHAGALIRVQLDLFKDEALQALLKTLDREADPFFSQNSHYYESVRSQWLQHYRYARRISTTYLKSTRRRVKAAELAKANAPPSPVSYSIDGPSRFVPDSELPENVALRALEQLGYKDLSLKDLERLHPPDQFEEELTLVADVRGYFQVAYKRIIDYIPLTIEHALNQALAMTLQGRLLHDLDVGGDDAAERVKELLSDDPAVAARRAELEGRTRRLEEIQAKLNRLRG